MLPIALTERHDTPEALAEGFALFTAAAGALESAYGKLQAEVAGLRRQLNVAQGELAREREAGRQWQTLAKVARVLAHELRNPLGSLELLAGLLASSRDLSAGDHETAARLQAGIRLLTATLNNILYYHQAGGGETTAVELAQLVLQTCDFLRPLLEQAGVKLRFSDGLLGARVAADPYRLQQVLLNLALNAVRAMPQGGRLRIAGRLGPGKHVRIAVLDSGPGVPAALRAKLFAPGVTSRPGGLGLGLAVAKAIIEQHGGEIRLLPTRRGAGFLITLGAL